MTLEENDNEYFKMALDDEIDNIECGNNFDLTTLYNWFLPTAKWDDSTGEQGIKLGNKIFERLTYWKRLNS